MATVLSKSVPAIAAVALAGAMVATASPAQAATPPLTYQAHVAEKGWLSAVGEGETAGTTGKGLRLEAFKVATPGATIQGHVQGIGWQSTVTTPGTVGTTGKSLRLEAIRAHSTRAGYALQCQAHVEGIGWKDWVGDGQTCGTTGQGLRMEAVRLKYVATGTTTNPPSTGSGPAAPNSTVTPNVSRQVIVARSSSATATSGTIAWYEWNGTSWTTVGTAGAVFGGKGIKAASLRQEGDRTTPGGTFGFVDEFGISNINGHGMPYKQLTDCTYMVSNPASSNYNRFVESCNSRPAGGVHMMDYVNRRSNQYNHAAWIDFNYVNPDRTAPGTGSGVFLHYEPAGYTTTGCVGVTDRAKLESILKWMDASKNPKIVVKAG